MTSLQAVLDQERHSQPQNQNIPTRNSNSSNKDGSGRGQRRSSTPSMGKELSVFRGEPNPNNGTEQTMQVQQNQVQQHQKDASPMLVFTASTPMGSIDVESFSGGKCSCILVTDFPNT